MKYRHSCVSVLLGSLLLAQRHDNNVLHGLFAGSLLLHNDGRHHGPAAAAALGVVPVPSAKQSHSRSVRLAYTRVVVARQSASA